MFLNNQQIIRRHNYQ